MVPDDIDLVTLKAPYLLVMLATPFYKGENGVVHIDALWAKDLVEHTRYIADLRLASYLIQGPLPAGVVAFDATPALRNVQRIELPAPKGSFHAIALLPVTLKLLWDALQDVVIVHSGVAGWPLPSAWLIVPMLWARKRFHIVVVESAFWRLTPGEPAGWKARLRASVSERLNRLCVSGASLSVFTQEDYKRSLLRGSGDNGHVIQASWIDAKDVLSSDEVAADVARGVDATKPLRLVFAGRLTKAKGVDRLVSVVAELVAAGLPIELDVFGDGPLLASCGQTIEKARANASIRLRRTVPYDLSFFAALRQFDAIVVPSMTDEQPRIVYDAYSQGLPVIAHNTPGLRQCVEAGCTGWLLAPGDAALSRLLSRLVTERADLACMRQACRNRAQRFTHQEMHSQRWRLLCNALSGRAQQ